MKQLFWLGRISRIKMNILIKLQFFFNQSWNQDTNDWSEKSNIFDLVLLKSEVKFMMMQDLKEQDGWTDQKI